MRQETQCSGEFLAFRGQLVFGAGRPIGVGPWHENGITLEALETVGEGVRRDARDLFEQLVEPAWSAQERLDNQEAPPVADSCQRVRKR